MDEIQPEGNRLTPPARLDGLTGPCCQYGNFETPHACAKQPSTAPATNIVIDETGSKDKRKGYKVLEDGPLMEVNGAGIPLHKLRQSTGRPKGARNLNAKHPSSIARAFRRAGLDWQADFALAIKGNNRARIKLWLRLLPYLVTTTNKARVKKWKGKASRAALAALDALEGKQ